MVRYRLALHAPIAGRVIIAESNYTYTAEPKPTYMRDALTREEIEKYNIRLVHIDFPPEAVQRVQNGGLVQEHEVDQVVHIGVRYAVHRTVADVPQFAIFGV